MNTLFSRNMLLTPLLALSLAGCASIEKAKTSWQGARYDEVIARWGAPSRSTTLADGSPVHTWVAEGGYSGGAASSIGIFGGSGGSGVGGSFIFGGGGGGEPQRCERTLIFKDQRVVDQTWIGEPSLCASFSR